MPDVMKNFIEPLTATLNVKADDPTVLFGDLKRELQHFDDAILKEAARRIRTRKPRKGYFRDAATFPTAADPIDWCAEILSQRDKVAQKDPEPETFRITPQSMIWPWVIKHPELQADPKIREMHRNGHVITLPVSFKEEIWDLRLSDREEHAA